MYRIIKGEIENLIGDVRANKWDNSHFNNDSKLGRFPAATRWFSNFPLITYLLINGIVIDIARCADSSEQAVRRYNIIANDNNPSVEFIEIILSFFNIDTDVLLDKLGIVTTRDVRSGKFKLFRIYYDADTKQLVTTASFNDETVTVTNALPPLLRNADGSLRSNYFAAIDNPLAMCLTALEILTNNKSSTTMFSINKDGLLDDGGLIEAYKNYSMRFAMMLATVVTKVNVKAGMGFALNSEDMYGSITIHKTASNLLPQTNFTYEVTKYGRVTMGRATSPNSHADCKLVTFLDGKYHFHGKLMDELWRNAYRIIIDSSRSNDIKLEYNYRCLNQGAFVPIRTIQEARALDKIFFSGNVITDNDRAFEDEFAHISKTRVGGFIAVIHNKCNNIGNNQLKTTVINLLTGDTFASLVDDVSDMVHAAEASGCVILPNNRRDGSVSYFEEAKIAKVIGIVLTLRGYLNVVSTKNPNERSNSQLLKSEISSFIRISGINSNSKNIIYKECREKGMVMLTLRKDKD